MCIATMPNRINLGGYYPSQGEQSFGEMRARYYVEYPNSLVAKIQEIQLENPEYDGPAEVLADMIAGDLDTELQADNEVNPEEYDREDWVEDQETDD